MNIIQKILDKERSFVEGINIRNKHNRIMSKRREEQNELVDRLNKIAEEFRKLMSNPKIQKFIKGIENLMFEELRFITLNSKSYEEQTLMAARISAQISLLEQLREEPQAVVRSVKESIV